MALNRIPIPTTDESALVYSDYAKLTPLMNSIFLNSKQPIRISGTNIKKGSQFQIAGVVYLADADTAISGVESAYVKITPAGATASASFVSGLTGVTWSYVYNGYYDMSGNLYIFNEHTALVDGEISSINGRHVKQETDGNIKLKLKGGVIIDSKDLQYLPKVDLFDTISIYSTQGDWCTGQAFDYSTGNLVTCGYNSTGPVRFVRVHDGISSTILSTVTLTYLPYAICIDPFSGNMLISESYGSGDGDFYGRLKIYDGISSTLLDTISYSFGSIQAIWQSMAVDFITGNLIASLIISPLSTPVSGVQIVFDGISVTPLYTLNDTGVEQTNSIYFTIDKETNNLISVDFGSTKTMNIFEGVPLATMSDYLIKTQSINSYSPSSVLVGPDRRLRFGHRVDNYALAQTFKNYLRYIP